MRIFTAVRFGSETQQYLKNTAGVLNEHFDNARFTRHDNLHMTIVFIGEADRKTVDRVIKSTKETASSIYEFGMTADGLSGFKRKNKYTVYCRVKDSADTTMLYGTMLNNLVANGVLVNSTDYKPHITLARQAVSKEGNRFIELPEHKIWVNSICVMESSRINGVLRYTPLAEFNLKEH